MELTICTMTGHTLSLSVEPHTTVGTLKGLIQSGFGEPPNRQKLKGDNGHVLSDDSKTLSDYQLHSGSTISLLIQDPPPPPPVQVFVKNHLGTTSTYDIKPGETVAQFKVKVQNKDKVTVDQQRLIFNGKQLEDNRKLEDYGITAHSSIQLTLRLRGG